MNYLANHLWQSTVFVVAVALTATVLKNNSARLRYWLWLAASTKFLIPFSVLVSLGGGVARPPVAPALSALAVTRVSTYFAPVPVFPTGAPTLALSYWHLAIPAVWALGTLLLLFRWYRRWSAIRNALRTAKALGVHPSLPALVCSSTIEPGVFGVFRPILLLPEGLPENLSTEQFRAVLDHELCHVRHRDNLTAALHMCVETLFWFHPIVWWIGGRLIEERERACDESVLKRGSDAIEYAQGIVSVCKAYHELPLLCVSGIASNNLTKRIRQIMTWRGTPHLTFARKSIVASAAILSVAVPLAIGIIRAQTLPPPPAFTYEVVSIHKSSPGQTGSRIGPGAGGGIRTQNSTAMQLLTFAFKVRDYQIVGAPGWVKSDCFDVSFTPEKLESSPPGPGSAPKQIEAFIGRSQQRMQAVLRDRFGLVLRAETHELPIYALVPAKGGLKLTPSVNAELGPSLQSNDGHLKGIGATLRMLAGHLSGVLGRPVIDQTGSENQYDFDLEYSPELPVPSQTDPAPPSTGKPEIVTALSEQLGLRLEPRKGAVPVYAIEKIEKPTEN